MRWRFLHEWRLKRKKEKARKAAELEKKRACEVATQEHAKLQELLKTRSDTDPAVHSQQMAYLEAQTKCNAAILALSKIQSAEIGEFVRSAKDTLQKQTDDLMKKVDDLRKRKP